MLLGPIGRVPALLALTLTGCGGPESPTGSGDASSVATTVTLSPQALAFSALGETGQLSASVLDQNGTTIGGASVTWTSSASTIAEVSSSGRVTAVAEGAATISGTSGSASGTASVTVEQVATSITLTPGSINLTGAGATTTVTAFVRDALGSEIAGATPTWSSDDESVATVSAAGVVTAVADGSTTITARVVSGGQTVTRTAPVTVGSSGTGDNYALEFFGTTADDVGRVNFTRSSQTATGVPANPLNFGGDFTIEFWILARSQNTFGASPGCNAPGIGWIDSNIVLDADRNSGGNDNDYGISIGSGRLQFGVADGFASYTVCGSIPVTDGAWHHVAFTRSASAAAMAIYVDGTLDVSTTAAPTGSVAFIQGSPGSPDDHLITLGVEHHDFVDRDFTGLIDEVRFSNVVRYAGASFSPPVAAFSPDANTVGLFHFDEGAGTVTGNSATVPFDAFWDPNGALAVGGSPPGPAWVLSTAPTGR